MRDIKPILLACIVPPLSSVLIQLSNSVCDCKLVDLAPMNTKQIISIHMINNLCTHRFFPLFFDRIRLTHTSVTTFYNSEYVANDFS